MSKDQEVGHVLLDQTFTYVKHKGTLKDPSGASSTVNCYSPAAQDAETQYLQSILPSKQQVVQIIEYYEESMLYWIGGLYYGKRLKEDLFEAYGASPQLHL